MIGGQGVECSRTARQSRIPGKWRQRDTLIMEDRAGDLRRVADAAAGFRDKTFPLMALCPLEAFNCITVVLSTPTFPVVVPGPFNAKSETSGPARMAYPAAGPSVVITLARGDEAEQRATVSTQPTRTPVGTARVLFRKIDDMIHPSPLLGFRQLAIFGYAALDHFCTFNMPPLLLKANEKSG